MVNTANIVKIDWKFLLVFLISAVVLSSLFLLDPSDLPFRRYAEMNSGLPAGDPAAVPASAFSEPGASTPTTYSQWTDIEIAFTGPDSEGMNEQENPFKIILDVTFTGPSGEEFLVPGFYDGDGSGGMDGNIWKVRFTPDAVGEWSFSTASAHPLLDGDTGTFEVVEPVGCLPYVSGSLPDFSCMGRFNSVGERYLQFSDGTYWLKGGEDDPEDFLGPGVTVGFESKKAAIDYLASNKLNSLYIMLHNIQGDENNVWPWVGASAAEAKANHEHFDLAKLAEWERIFSYLQEKGLALHLVLEDDSGWTGFNRSMYYREMIARFGHHNGLIWNISEEYDENYSPQQIAEFAKLIKDLDPYDHPITVHHAGATRRWEPFLGNQDIGLTSFQTEAEPQNDVATDWVEKIQDSGHIIPISFDETGKIAARNRELSRHIVWSVYFGGGNFELHTSPLSDYRDFSEHFQDLRRARKLVEELPYWEMRPMNHLLLGGDGYVFAKPDNTYAVYLPNGGAVRLSLPSSGPLLNVFWYNPRTGSLLPQRETVGSGTQTFTAPLDGDAVLLLMTDAAGSLSLSGDAAYLPCVLNKTRSPD